MPHVTSKNPTPTLPHPVIGIHENNADKENNNGITTTTHANTLNGHSPSILGHVNGNTQLKMTNSALSNGKKPKSAKRTEKGSSVRSGSPLSPRNGGPSLPKSTPTTKRNGVRSSNSRQSHPESRGQPRFDGASSPEASSVNGKGNAGKREPTGKGASGLEGGWMARSPSRQSRQGQTSYLSDDVSRSSDIVSLRSASSQQQNALSSTTSSSSSSEDLRLPLSPWRTSSPRAEGEGLQKLRARRHTTSATPIPQQRGGGGAAIPASPVPPHIAHAWDMFEEHVRMIHDSTDMFARRNGPSFSASSTFQETMTEIFGYPEYAKPPPPTVPEAANRTRYVSNVANRFLNLRKRTSVAPGAAKAPVKEVSRRTVENARRGWRILKQHVQEAWVSKRTSTAALSWSMLRQTLKGMSDMDRTRWDLYKRYGIVPTVDSQGNVVMENTMLSERARKAIASGARHPLLAHAPAASTPPLIHGHHANPVMGHGHGHQPHHHHPSSHHHLHHHSPHREEPMSASLSTNLSFSSSADRSHRARRAPVRPHTSAASVGFGLVGGGIHERNSGAHRKESEVHSKTLVRSHTP